MLFVNNGPLIEDDESKRNGNLTNESILDSVARRFLYGMGPEEFREEIKHINGKYVSDLEKHVSDLEKRFLDKENVSVIKRIVCEELGDLSSKYLKYEINDSGDRYKLVKLNEVGEEVGIVFSYCGGSVRFCSVSELDPIYDKIRKIEDLIRQRKINLEKVGTRVFRLFLSLSPEEKREISKRICEEGGFVSKVKY